MSNKYTLKALEDRRYSLGSKVINTALSVGALAGIKPAKRALKKRATKFALRKAADGASGVIAAKAGVDKESVKELVHGVGAATGIGDRVAKKLSDGSASRGVANVGNKIKNAAAQARLKMQRSFGTGPKNTSTTTTT